MRNGLRLPTLILAASAAAFAQGPPADSAPDPAFAAIPFNRWLSEQDQTRFPWSARVSGAVLATSQRLGVRVDVQIDGSELLKRRGNNEITVFIQFSDNDHRVFQSHGGIPLQQVADTAAESNFIYTQTALVVPGDYRVDIAILDAKTGEHATLRRTLHVAPLRNDPLPDAWRRLPLVEFTGPGDPPDSWFQPYLRGRLSLPLEARRPVRVEVLMNASPSPLGGRLSSSLAGNRNLEDLIPALKVISQVEVGQGTLNISLLDLTRRKVLFTQSHVQPKLQPLEWSRLRPGLQQADPNLIDVRDLEERRRNPQFFVEEVRRRLLAEGSAGEPGLSLIVLSAPMAFAEGADLHPIELPGRPPAKVFYIRYHSAPARISGERLSPLPNRRRGFPPRQPGIMRAEAPDALEPLLKPLQPRLFEVYGPEQFRKALAQLMQEIARL